MCAKKEDEEEEDCSQQAMNQSFQQQLLIQQQISNQQTTQASSSSNNLFGSNVSGFIFPQVNGQDWLVNPMMSHFPNPTRDLDPFLFPPPPPSPIYGSFFNRRALGYEGLASTSAAHHHHHHHQEHFRVLSEALGPVVQTGSGPFSFQTEIGKMTAQEILDAKALAASKSHSEAERRRRERINSHLARLRSLLPNTTKTDKASLLAEVIQHVKELKRQTSVIAETNPIPTETEELTVDTSDEEDDKFVIKVSLCCEDRSDLLPDLIKTLKSLRLKTLRAEITAIAGRVRNVLFVTTEDGSNDDQEFCVSSIKEALKTVMEKSGSADESSPGNTKRQRTVNAIKIVEQQHPNRSL